MYRYLLLLSVLLLAMFPVVGFGMSGGPKGAAAHRKGAVAEDMPVPDMLVRPARKNASLPEQLEAGDPNSNDGHIRGGIDVSHYQGRIDWDEVAKDTTVGYVYIKATEGESLEDDRYEFNLREARRVGIKAGSYHFFRGNVAPEMQLRNMVSKVRKEEQDLIPIIDVEHIRGVSHSRFVERLHTFLKLVTRHYGQKPLLYTFVNFYNKYLLGEGFRDYPMMIAFYRDEAPTLRDGHKYIIWQYTASGEVDGIGGDVDKSKVMDGFTIRDLYMR